MSLENLKSIYNCCSVLVESYDKIKTSAPDIKIIWGNDMFNIVDTNSWLIIENLVNPLKNGSKRHYSYLGSDLIMTNFFNHCFP